MEDLHCKVQAALGRNTQNWRVKWGCPCCSYKARISSDDHILMPKRANQRLLRLKARPPRSLSACSSWTATTRSNKLRPRATARWAIPESSTATTTLRRKSSRSMQTRSSPGRHSHTLMCLRAMMTMHRATTAIKVQKAILPTVPRIPPAPLTGRLPRQMRRRKCGLYLRRLGCSLLHVAMVLCYG